MPRINLNSVLATLFIGLSTTFVAGCAGSGSGGDGLFSIQGTSALVTGDWVDVNAAVQAAAQHREMVVESESQPDAKTLRFDLLTVKGEPVMVRVTRSSEADASVRPSREGPVAMTVEVRVGRFGDSRRERELLDDIRSRLGDLVGPFKTKPLPESWGGWGN